MEKSSWKWNTTASPRWMPTQQVLLFQCSYLYAVYNMQRNFANKKWEFFKDLMKIQYFANLDFSNIPPDTEIPQILKSPRYWNLILYTKGPRMLPCFPRVFPFFKVTLIFWKCGLIAPFLGTLINIKSPKTYFDFRFFQLHFEVTRECRLHKKDFD